MPPPSGEGPHRAIHFLYRAYARQFPGATRRVLGTARRSSCPYVATLTVHTCWSKAKPVISSFGPLVSQSTPSTETPSMIFNDATTAHVDAAGSSNQGTTVVAYKSGDNISTGDHPRGALPFVKPAADFELCGALELPLEGPLSFVVCRMRRRTPGPPPFSSMNSMPTAWRPAAAACPVLIASSAVGPGINAIGFVSQTLTRIGADRRSRA